MAKLYTYCLRYDTGAAPNPFWGICTLVICKPKIRLIAKEGDWVVGTGSKDLPKRDISKHVVYAMRISSKMSLECYDEFCRKYCPNKIPDWGSSDYWRRAGDCIYDYSSGSPPPKLRPSAHDDNYREKDLSGKYALISDHFYYFGDNPKELPPNLHPIIKKGQGHRSDSNSSYIDAFIKWVNELGLKPNVLHGQPQIKLDGNLQCPSCEECFSKKIST